MKFKILKSCLLLVVLLISGCSSCPDTGLIGPGFIQSTISHFNVHSENDLLKFRNSAGEVLEFHRVRPERKFMEIRKNYRSVSCEDDENHMVLLSSELEQLENLFVTEAGDSIQVGLKLINFNLFDPFNPEDESFKRFPVYLDLEIYLNRIDQKMGQTYIAYWNNFEDELPVDWPYLSFFNRDLTDVRSDSSIYGFPQSNGIISYSRNEGITSFRFSDNTGWIGIP
ncbi:hypothetical protein [Neolewinella persica]|uniref:hypothetical protein n=1 Tax=Neolewinella persica TaxID=70998 RepID=UPI00039A101E|nr:hypothetical protein [Neolewinella persica]